MTPERHRRLMELFDEACELPAAAARDFLSRLAGDDAELRGELEQMLRADHSEIFFDETSGGRALLARQLFESALGRAGLPRDPGKVPERIAEFEVLERLGAGGMGTVYRVRQSAPERVVALKVLHPWLMSEATLERFRFEARALATLRHPSIPPVYAVGQHEGLVWLTMELVSGPTLLDFAARQRLALRARVELMAKVCDAVHHAHLRGFVHRDLKPDNLRVADDGVPRVLDFGIAAGLGETSSEVAGTPAYMAPEQLEPGAVVDVRSDVFALGLIASELFDGRGSAQARRATDDAAKEEGHPVVDALPAELRFIIARATAPSPGERYASAADLADELRRWLGHFPVRAHPGGRAYRFGRFLRRHRVMAAVVALAFTGVLAGLLVAWSQYRQARSSFERADDEARRAAATLGFVISVLKQGDPERAGRDVTVHQAVDRAAERLRSDPKLSTEQPRVATAIHASLAETYQGLGDWVATEREARAALTLYEHGQLADDELLAKTLLLLAQVHHQAGRGDEARATSVRAIAVERALHPEPHTHVGFALHVHAVALREAGFMAEAVRFHREGVELERALAAKTGKDEDLADALNQLAVTLAYLGRYDEAEPLYREAMRLDLAEFGPRHPEVAVDLHHLAWLANERDDAQTAKALLDQALEIRLSTLGKEHTRVGIQRNLEAYVELALGHVELADAAEDEALRIAEKSFGVEHPRYTRAAQARVPIRVAQGRTKEAVALARQLVELHAKRYGERHWVTAGSRSDLGLALLADGARDEGRRELKDALAVLEESLGPASKVTRDARKRLSGP
ncbi:MAG: protein kinase domain-containing protein [Myxococcota bacterium]